MHIVVTGSRGLIGAALVNALRTDGHRVTPLVRGAPEAEAAVWDPEHGTVDSAAIDGCDAVVHLAGEGIADHRWTDGHKQAVLDSRVKGTSLLASTLAGLNRPPSVLASGSAIGFYGNRGDAVLDENASVGEGFLAEVVSAWEGATAAAEAAGIRVAHLRTGIVLSTKGGALKKQLLPFKLGLGGRFGSGRQYQSWIALNDEVRAIQHVLASATLRGPVNLVAPNPVTNADFTAALGKALHRPTLVPTPLFAVKALFGAEMVSEMLLSSQRVAARKLVESGFAFSHTDLSEALNAILANHG